LTEATFIMIWKRKLQLCSKLIIVVTILCAGTANGALGPPGTADLVQLLNLGSLPNGVESSEGFCADREGKGAAGSSDVAYTIKDRNAASIPTTKVFPEGFPSDFSILTTFKAERRSKSMLFTTYSADGKEVLSLKVGRRLKLSYQGINTKSRRVVKLSARLADGQ
jgi:collagen type V/XI/XXIV/XXVII alpha